MYFLKLSGTLEQYDAAVVRVEAQLKRIEERRAKVLVNSNIPILPIDILTKCCGPSPCAKQSSDTPFPFTSYSAVTL